MPSPIPVVYSCCSVAKYGYTQDPCWVCGEQTGRDAWQDTYATDYDGLITRRNVITRAKL